MVGGEQAVKIGADGETMLEGFLKLIGWESISRNEQFGCLNSKKHKSPKQKGDRESHNIDAVFYYDNPLNHSEKDIILCSSKHNQDKYSDKGNIFKFLKDLAQSLECAPVDSTFSSDFNQSDKKLTYKGLVFWISSKDEERSMSMVDRIGTDVIADEEEAVPKLIGLKYNSIYLVDNSKATFIVSAIETAKHINQNAAIKFLYPHTGLNNESEELFIAGEIMPIQYVNSSLLPIVLQEENKNSLFLFCNENFIKESLKRVIWFAHKVSGLTNEIIIFYRNYDHTQHDSDVQRIKGLFADNSLTRKIKVQRLRTFDFVTLKEDSIGIDKGIVSERRIQSKKQSSKNISDDLDKILPFGQMIKPVISSSILSDSDIKAFLIRKGIFLGKSEKSNTIPLLSTLLLSPEELNTLKDLLKSKEDKVKSVNRSASLTSSEPDYKQIELVINQNLSAPLPINCKLTQPPTIKKLADNQYRIDFSIERENSSKDLVIGKQQHDGSILCTLENGKINSRIDYTSRETYKYGTTVFRKIEDGFLDDGIIQNKFSLIRFNMFNNTQRIHFFLSFLNMNDVFYFNDPILEHIKVKPDHLSEEELPFDLESLREKVKDLAISGKALDTIHYFKDEYKRHLLMQRVKIKYKYTTGIENGTCIIDMDFRNALNYGDMEAELNCNLEIVKSKSNKGKSVENTKKLLLAKFNKLVEEQYKKYVI